MKCPKCGTVLQKTENGEYICTPSCKATYSEKELKDIQDIKRKKNVMKCPKCGTVLQKTENGEYICKPSCGMIYSEKELKEIQDIQMLDEDLEIWKKAQKYK